MTLKEQLKQESYIQTHKWIKMKLNNETDLTWDEIAEKLGYSRQWLFQLRWKYFPVENA